jgi:hypothetical protein
MPWAYCPVAALNFTTSSAGTRQRSFTSMPCALAHSRTSVVFSPLADPRRPPRAGRREPNTTDLRRAGSHEAVTWDQLDRIHLSPSASCDPRAIALGEWRSQTVHSGHSPGPPEGNQGCVCARQRIAYRCQGQDRTADLALFRSARPRIAVVSMAASGSSAALAENTQVKSQVTGGGQGVGVILAQDLALAVQGVLVQVAGGLHLAQLA